MIALDGTPTKSRLGADALLGVSMAVAGRRRGARRRSTCFSPPGAAQGDQPDVLPVPMMDHLNGGAHADSSVDLQEFMVMPAAAATFADAIRTGAESSTPCAPS